MNQHPHREQLLKYHYGLLTHDDANQGKMDQDGGAQDGMDAAHIVGCTQCQTVLADLTANEGKLLAQPQPQPGQPPQKASWLRRLLGWTTPVSVLALVVFCIALQLPQPLVQAVMFAGAVAVVLWLHMVALGVEQRWRLLAEEDWSRALPRDRQQRKLVVDGIRLSALDSVERARSNIRFLLVATLVLTMAGAAIATILSFISPSAGAMALEKNPMLVPEAAALGLYFAGLVWVSLRLVRLARAIKNLTQTMIETPE